MVYLQENWSIVEFICIDGHNNKFLIVKMLMDG